MNGPTTDGSTVKSSSCENVWVRDFNAAGFVFFAKKKKKTETDRQADTEKEKKTEIMAGK